MRKIFWTISGIAIFSLILTMPATILAANITFNATSNIYISDLAETFVIDGTADQLVVNASTITITTCAGCTVKVQSNNSKQMSTDKPGTNSVCASDHSYVEIYTPSSETVVVTPSSTTCVYSSGGSSGGGGGGGTPPTVPSNTSIYINNDVAKTTSLDVILTIEATDATLMMISNNSDFSDVTAWEDYATSKSWILADDISVIRTVYAKFRSSSGGESTTISDSITYSESTEEEEVVAEEEPTILSDGTIVKEPGKNSVYYVEGGVLKPIPNANIFQANNLKWSDIKIMDLSGYQIGDNLSYPADYNFTDGMLVKSSTTGLTKVYVVSNGKLRWIKSETVFNALGYKWSKINEISDAKLAEYQEGDEIALSDRHPDGTLIKNTSNSKVYLIENGMKRWITSENEFNARGYDWGLIIEVVSSNQYVLGDNIGAAVLGVETVEVFTEYLTVGSTGQQVSLLQTKLKELGYFNYTVTGYYGPITKQAVIDFQKANGLDPLGVIGPGTRSALNSLY